MYKRQGYRNAKLTIKLINSVADVINNDPVVNGRIKVVFIENYRVSNAEWIFAAADVSEQISTASKEASGTGNMKFMLNGALTLGTMDGANVEIVEEVGKENAFIFGLSADQVIQYENFGGYNPMDIFNNDQDIRRVLMQLINGTYSANDTELFRPLYNSLLNTQSTSKADTYFILADFKAYAEAQRRVEAVSYTHLIITVTIFNFLSVWNEFFMALIFASSAEMTPVGVGLLQIVNSMKYTGNYGGLFAAVVIVFLPTFLLYLFLSEKIIAGVTGGGIKG